MVELEARVAIAQATRDHWVDRPLVPGTDDCAKMTRWHARRMGCPIKGTAKAGNYRSLRGMKRALAKLGAETVGDICAMQPGWIEIAPAAAWPGDVIELESGETDVGALAIVLTNGRALAFAEELEGGRCAVGQPHAYRRAWRLPWKAAESSEDNG